MADIIKAFLVAVSPEKGRGTKRKREEEDEEEETPEDEKKEQGDSDEEQDKKRAKMDEEGMCQHTTSSDAVVKGKYDGPQLELLLNSY